MNKKYLNQMLTYFSKVYPIGEKINSLRDNKINSPVKNSTIKNKFKTGIIVLNFWVNYS